MQTVVENIRVNLESLYLRCSLYTRTLCKILTRKVGDNFIGISSNTDTQYVYGKYHSASTSVLLGSSIIVITEVGSLIRVRLFYLNVESNLYVQIRESSMTKRLFRSLIYKGNIVFINNKDFSRFNLPKPI